MPMAKKKSSKKAARKSTAKKGANKSTKKVAKKTSKKTNKKKVAKRTASVHKKTSKKVAKKTTKKASAGKRHTSKKRTKKAVRKVARKATKKTTTKKSAPKKRIVAGKLVYAFGKKTEGDGSMKTLLGGKGANLAEMTSIGLPVPPGFTITTDTCAAYYKNKKRLPKGLMTDVAKHLSLLEKQRGKKFGDQSDPLLVSVRSGAAVSMPGMMDTILNLGLNDKSVKGLAVNTGNERFAYDAYRRLINMFGDVVMGVDHHHFEHAFNSIKVKYQVTNDTDVPAEGLKELCVAYKEVYAKHVGSKFPQNPVKQLELAINAVFGSWNADKAISYRRIEGMVGLNGTAVNVQTMVFGNMGDDCGTGVAFTRNPSTGENKFYGEFLVNAQGEDVVAGIRTPQPVDEMPAWNNTIYKQLLANKKTLEDHYGDMQDIEFTIEQGELFMLQTRTGKRTGPAAVNIACDMVKEETNHRERSALAHPCW